MLSSLARVNVSVGLLDLLHFLILRGVRLDYSGGSKTSSALVTGSVWSLKYSAAVHAFTIMFEQF